MTIATANGVLPMRAWLLGVGILAVLLLLEGEGNPVAALTGLDLHYLALPLALSGALLLLSHLVPWAGGTNTALRLARRLTPDGDEAAAQRRLAALLPVAHRLLAGLGWTALILGVLASIPLLPATISERPNGPDLSGLDPYAKVFGSLVTWGVVLLVPLVVLRAMAEARPVVGEIVRVPRLRLVVFGISYALLADEGVLSVAFDVQGSGVLLGLGLALALSYGASMLRNAGRLEMSLRFPRALRGALLIFEIAILAALLAAVSALPSAVEPSLGAVNSLFHNLLQSEPPPSEVESSIDMLPVSSSVTSAVDSSTDVVFGLKHGIGLPSIETPDSVDSAEPAQEPESVEVSELDPDTISAYMGILHRLNSWAVLILLAFGLVRALAFFLPVVDRAFGFPIARLILLAVVYVAFSEGGVLSTALGVTTSQAMTALTLALAVSYAATILRNIAGIEMPGRVGQMAARVSGTLSPLAFAAAPAMAALVTLNHLPVASAALLDHSASREFGENFLPHFGILFDTRYTIAALVFLIGLAVSLPRALEGQASRRYQPVLAAAAYGAVGCLAWITGSYLSSLGHGFVLGGAVASAGMFSLALTRLAVYATAPSGRFLADIANWLAASRVRGFVLGAAVAFYGALLRPVLYETLWLAALYEYVALLVLTLLVFVHSMRRLGNDTAAPEAAQPGWTDWSHHRQVLETKADPRSELTSTLGRRFVDYGEWRPLWTYLMGLLYRSEASLDAMRSACRPLRSSIAVSPLWNLPGMKRINRSKRRAALEESLNSVDQALALPAAQLQPVHEDALRESAAPFIETGADPEALAVSLVAAHCQRGEDLEQAIAQWFSLFDAPSPSRGWLRLPWTRSGVAHRDRRQRMSLVDNAVAQLFGNPARPSFDTLA